MDEADHYIRMETLRGKCSALTESQSAHKPRAFGARSPRFRPNKEGTNAVLAVKVPRSTSAHAPRNMTACSRAPGRSPGSRTCASDFIAGYAATPVPVAMDPL